MLQNRQDFSVVLINASSFPGKFKSCVCTLLSNKCAVMQLRELQLLCCFHSLRHIQHLRWSFYHWSSTWGSTVFRTIILHSTNSPWIYVLSTLPHTPPTSNFYRNQKWCWTELQSCKSLSHWHLCCMSVWVINSRWTYSCVQFACSVW